LQTLVSRTDCSGFDWLYDFAIPFSPPKDFNDVWQL
jgi:hypothetical protein